MFRPGRFPKPCSSACPRRPSRKAPTGSNGPSSTRASCGRDDRVVINLAPAELPKQAASFDLPITLGILAGSGQIASELFERYAVVGELALDGSTRPTRGALSMAMAAAEQKGLRGLVVPTSSAAEAAVVEGIEVIAVSSLAQAVAFFTGADRNRSHAAAAGRVVSRVFGLRRRFRRRPRPGNGQARHHDRRRGAP